MKKEPEVDLSKVTLTYTLRVPPAIRAVALEPEWAVAQFGDLQITDLGRTRHLLVLQNNAPDAVFGNYQNEGADIDDSLYKMRTPVLVAQPAGLTENIVYLKVLGMDQFAPRCMLPLGATGMEYGEPFAKPLARTRDGRLIIR